MKHCNILIVEDEFLIAKSIISYLESKGNFRCLHAASFQEAIKHLNENYIDIALIDIRINSIETGIDIAKFIRVAKMMTEFVFLTSQVDEQNLLAAIETEPAGYLSKPIHKQTLYNTVTLAYNKSKNNSNNYIQINVGNLNRNILIKNIKYIKSEHIYLYIFLENEDKIMTRMTLNEMGLLLEKDLFISPHRSYLVRLEAVKAWNNSEILVDNISIPISRSKRKEIITILDNNM